MKKLTVIIPVFNEDGTLPQLLQRVLAVPVDKQVLVVDDGSEPSARQWVPPATDGTVQLIEHEHNRGKGACIRTALPYATGDAVLIQDADLEYFPEDYPKLLSAFAADGVQAVYGVRNLRLRSPLMRWGNLLLTRLTNLLFHSDLSDMETCYKLIDRRLLQQLGIESQGFEVEAEITAKLLLSGVPIHQVPIRYQHRSDGKKLSALDGLPTALTLLRYWRNGLGQKFTGG
ncbi:MAG: glycosyltransferase family 2 protein [Calditrichaeota bacterium]|nr:MAG: glycosyltransferase family 2 protein [Calditrichota bacterium]